MEVRLLGLQLVRRRRRNRGLSKTVGTTAASFQNRIDSTPMETENRLLVRRACCRPRGVSWDIVPCADSPHQGMSPVAIGDQVLHSRSCVPLQFGNYVRVSIHREGDLRVTKHIHNYTRRDTLNE